MAWLTTIAQDILKGVPLLVNVLQYLSSEAASCSKAEKGFVVMRCCECTVGYSFFVQMMVKAMRKSKKVICPG
jgi:hypothetical protein